MPSLHAPSDWVNIFTLAIHVLKFIMTIEEQEEDAAYDIENSSNAYHEGLLQVDCFKFLANFEVVFYSLKRNTNRVKQYMNTVAEL